MKTLLLTTNINPKYGQRATNLDIYKNFCSKYNIDLKFCDSRQSTMLTYNLTNFPTAYINFSGYPNTIHYRFCRYLELNNVNCIDKIKNTMNAHDKMLSYLDLKYNGVEVVDTISLGQIFEHHDPIKLHESVSQIEDLIGYPCVIKPTKLGLNLGVVKCDNRNSLIEILGLIFCTDSRKMNAENYNSFIVQKFVSSAVGKKYRVYLHKDEPLAFVRYITDEGYWRANLHTAKHLEILQPTNELIDLCRNIHKILNINYSGIDFHYIDKDKFIVNEINPFPDLENPILNHEQMCQTILGDLLQEKYNDNTFNT